LNVGTTAHTVKKKHNVCSEAVAGTDTV